MSNQRAFQDGNRRYRAGVQAAKHDYYTCGAGTVRSELLYGLQGYSATYCKGYKDYYRRYIGV